MPPPTTPSEPRLPASLEALSADDPGLLRAARAGRRRAARGQVGRPWSPPGCGSTRLGSGGCDLSGAALADPELTDAVLDEPNLANAVIRGGSLTRVLVSGGRLTGAQWAETRIHDTVWRNAAADLSAFRLSELVRVTFDSCNLREADFTGASCSWVRFHDCDLTGAVFSKARFVELRAAALPARGGRGGRRPGGHVDGVRRGAGAGPAAGGRARHPPAGRLTLDNQRSQPRAHGREPTRRPPLQLRRPRRPAYVGRHTGGVVKRSPVRADLGRIEVIHPGIVLPENLRARVGM